MKNIAAIVVTFNKKEYLRENVEALLKQTHPLTILVIDNDSHDGTVEMMRQYTDRKTVLYFNTGANLGGAGGFHYGIKKAAELGFDYFWLMDDDAMPEPDALSAVVAAAETLQDNFSFLCSNVRFTDGTACKMNVPDLTENWLNEDALLKEGLLSVDRATFVGFFIPKRVVSSIGLPIKEFFIWSDDTNYSHRAVKTAPAYLVLNSKITHKMAQNETASLVKDNSDRLGRYYYAYRNRHYNARHEGWEGKYLLRILTTTFHILTSSGNKTEKLKVMYRGAWDGLFFEPAIEFLP